MITNVPKKAKQRSRPAKKGGNKSRSGTSQGSQQTRQQSGSMPVQYFTQVRVREPRITSSEKCTRVIHKELVGTVNSSSNSQWEITPGLGLQSSGILRVNPGSGTTFPWLSNLALGFERYKFRRCSFVYIPRCPTNTFGNLMLTPDYDAEDAKPINEQVAASNVDSVEKNVFMTFSCSLKPERMNRNFKTHNVMSDSRFQSTSQDTKTIDVAQVVISDDVLAATSLGKLWVEYDVEFYDPQLNFDLSRSTGTNFTFTTPNLTTSNKPIIQTPNNIAQNAANPLLVNLPGSTENPVPTATLGTFTGPFNGILSQNFTGTGLNTIASVVPLLNGVALNTLPWQFPELLNSGNTAYQSSYSFKANAGDILSLPTMAGATALASSFLSLAQQNVY